MPALWCSDDRHRNLHPRRTDPCATRLPSCSMITHCSHPTSAIHRLDPIADVSPYAAVTSLPLRCVIQQSGLAPLHLTIHAIPPSGRTAQWLSASDRKPLNPHSASPPHRGMPRFPPLGLARRLPAQRRQLLTRQRSWAGIAQPLTKVDVRVGTDDDNPTGSRRPRDRGATAEW